VLDRLSWHREELKMSRYKYVPAKMMGCCPNCAGIDGRINDGKDHWGVCEAHKVKWFIGTDMWGDWRKPTSTAGLKLLAECRKVDFVRPNDPQPDAWKRETTHGAT
jgi:hypothetical protein